MLRQKHHPAQTCHLRFSHLPVLAPLEEPTEWGSQIAVVKKPDRSLRICLDPQPLNEALQLEHYRLPAFNNVLSTLTNAKIVSKLDVKHAFWHVQLDSQSILFNNLDHPIWPVILDPTPFRIKG